MRYTDFPSKQKKFIFLRIYLEARATATKVKLYPNQAQKALLEKQFGSCRFVYNYFLAKRDEYYITHLDAKKSSLNYFDTQNTLVELKKQYP